MPVFLRNLSQAALRTLASFRLAMSSIFSPRKLQSHSLHRKSVFSRGAEDEWNENEIASSIREVSPEDRDDLHLEEIDDDKTNSTPPTERPCHPFRRRSRRLTGIDLSYQNLPPSTSGDDLLKWTLVKEALASAENISPCSSATSLSSMRFSVPSLIQRTSPSELTSSGSSDGKSLFSSSMSLSFLDMSPSTDSLSPEVKKESASQLLKQAVLQEEASRFLAPPTLKHYRGSFSRSVESLSDYYSALSC